MILYQGVGLRVFAVFVFLNSGFFGAQKTYAEFQPAEANKYKCMSAMAAFRGSSQAKKQPEYEEALQEWIALTLGKATLSSSERSRLEVLRADLKDNPDQILFVGSQSGAEVGNFLAKAESIKKSMIAEDYRGSSAYVSAAALASSIFFPGPLVDRILLSAAGAGRLFEARTQGVDGRKLEALSYFLLGLHLIRQGGQVASIEQVIAGASLMGASGVRYFFPGWSRMVTDGVLSFAAMNLLLETQAINFNTGSMHLAPFNLFFAASFGLLVSGSIEVLNRIKNRAAGSSDALKSPDAIEQMLKDSKPVQELQFALESLDFLADKQLRTHLLASRKIFRSRPDLAEVIRQNPTQIQLDQILLNSPDRKSQGPILFTIVRWKPATE